MQKESVIFGVNCIAPVRTEKWLKQMKKMLEANENLKLKMKYFSMLADPTRCKIIFLLLTEKKLCVCDFANILDVSVSAVSQHLKKLRDFNLVSSEKEKQTVFYYIESRKFKRFLSKFL